MNDLISRQATIDALDALCDRECEYSKQQRSFMCGACRLGSAVDVIDELPSAQPEYTEQDMREQFNAGYACGMHAAQTEHTETHSCDYQRTETHDLVSRQAALEAMDTWDKFGCDPDGKLVRYDDDKHYVPYVHYEDMVHAVKNLPSAQPERKKGKWLADNRPGGGFWVCSCCKFPSEAFAANVLYNFCPNCGAKMEGTE